MNAAQCTGSLSSIFHRKLIFYSKARYLNEVKGSYSSSNFMVPLSWKNMIYSSNVCLLSWHLIFWAGIAFQKYLLQPIPFQSREYRITEEKDWSGLWYITQQAVQCMEVFLSGDRGHKTYLGQRYRHLNFLGERLRFNLIFISSFMVGRKIPTNDWVQWNWRVQKLDPNRTMNSGGRIETINDNTRSKLL